MSEQDFKLFKKWLLGHLKFGPVTLVFDKKDGEERRMLCTLHSDLVPEIKSEENKKKVNDDICVVYDIEIKGWRSFRWDSVKQVIITIGEEFEPIH